MRIRRKVPDDRDIVCRGGGGGRLGSAAAYKAEQRGRGAILYAALIMAMCVHAACVYIADVVFSMGGDLT